MHRNGKGVRVTAGRKGARAPSWRSEGTEAGDDATGEVAEASDSASRARVPGGSAPTHKVPRVQSDSPSFWEWVALGVPEDVRLVAGCKRGKPTQTSHRTPARRPPGAARTSSTPHQESGAGFGLPGVDYK